MSFFVRGELFSKGKTYYIIVSMNLVFSIRLISIPDLLCLICAMYVTRINAVS